MHTLSRRRVVGSALALLTTGCYGKFALTQKLYGWNGSLGNKFVNTIVFWAFIVLPVYEVFAFVDFVALNLIEFWSGSNPLAVLDHDDGSRTRLTRLAHDVVRLERMVDGVVTRSFELHRPTETSAMALDAQGLVISQAEVLPSGSLRADSAMTGEFELSAQALRDIAATRSVGQGLANLSGRSRLASR